MSDWPDNQLEVERRCYEETGSVLHPWAAYRLARVNKVPVPEWVLQYFDKAANNLFELNSQLHQGEKVGDLAAAASRAMGLTGGRGQGSAFSKYNRKWIVYGMNVRAWIQDGEKEYRAIEIVAERLQVDKSTVRRGWKEYQKRFPGSRIFPDEALS